MVWNFKDIGLATLYSFILITILNYLAHQAFGLPILKTGVAIIIFLVGVILASIFVFTRDGSFSREDVTGLLVVTVVVLGIYFAIKFTLPELFSSLPNNLKEVFSTLGV